MSDDKQPPIISTPFGGPTTEWARKQAALNIARDADLRARMIERFGEGRVRRDYPEAFEDDVL